MTKPASSFGWKNVFKNYGWKGILEDSLLPLIISSILCIIMYFNDADVYAQLKHITEVGISVVPTMVALILTAYTIMLTFIIGDKFSSIKETDEGKELIQGLNSSFAACLFVSIISITTMIIVSCVVNMNISVENSNSINYPVFILICFLLLYSVSILIGIVIDIFNSGQTILLDNSKENKHE